MHQRHSVFMNPTGLAAIALVLIAYSSAEIRAQQPRIAMVRRALARGDPSSRASRGCLLASGLAETVSDH